MTKKGLAEAIHNKIGLSKRESAEIVEYFFETMKKNLERGESIKLPKFGTFKIQHKEKRKSAQERIESAVGSCCCPKWCHRGVNKERRRSEI